MDPRRLISEGAPESSLPLRSGDVVMERVLRWLPGRRLTVSGQWKTEPAVVKFFAAGAREKKAFSREVSALYRLHDQGVAAPAVLASSFGAEGGVLVMEKLEGETALSYCAAGAREQRTARIRELIHWVLETQRKGVLQKDIHLGNFFRADEQWYMLDAAACEFGEISQAAAKKNLACLIAQFAPLDVARLDDILNGMRESVAAARDRRYRKMLEKAERDCTEFARIRKGCLQGMCRREFLDQVSALLEGGLDRAMSDADMLKNGNSATVVLEPRRHWVIKRYNLKSFWHWLKRQWGRSRAKNAWLAGCFLRAIGVRTPLPLAFIEERRAGVVCRAWIVTQQVSGKELADVADHDSLSEAVLEDLQGFVSLMALLKFSHGDMKASNFIIEGDGLCVIDLDSFSLFESRRKNEKRRKKDIARLLRNWPQEAPVRRRIEKRVGG